MTETEILQAIYRAKLAGDTAEERRLLALHEARYGRGRRQRPAQRPMKEIGTLTRGPDGVYSVQADHG